MGSWQWTNLGEIFDPWLASEENQAQRRAVSEVLFELAATHGLSEESVNVVGTSVYEVNVNGVHVTYLIAEQFHLLHLLSITK